MTALRIPRGALGWQGWATVLLLMLVPVAVVVHLTPSTQRLSDLAALRTLVLAAGLVAAMVAFYVHHRVTGQPQSGWLTVAVGLATVPALAFGFFSLAHARASVNPLGWTLLYQPLQMLLMLGILLAARRVRLPVDPLAMGLVLGLVLSVLRPLVVVSARPEALSATDLALAGLGLGVVTLATGLPLLSLVTLPRWLRIRSLLALGLLGASITLDPVATRSHVAAIAGLLATAAGSVLVTTGAAAYVQLTLIGRRDEVAQLEQQLADVESDALADRARLHEIGSTVAGIASASRLMYSTPDLSESRRDVLAGMVAAEVARLQRLTADHEPGRVRMVALDDVLGRVALAHRARGCRVDWSVSGLRVVGTDDGVTHVLDELLHNAARHGSPERIRVTTRRHAGEALVTVTDDGPGVPVDARPHLFDDQADGDGAAGSLGLPMARRRARAMGGDLWLRDSRSGARFVLRLALAPETSSEPLGGRPPRPSLAVRPGT